MMELPDDPSDRVLEQAYAEMRRIARRRVQASGIGSFDGTDLVNEAYIRLVERARSWDSRNELLYVSSRAMHDILVEHARKKDTVKRGGDLERVDWENVVQVADKHPHSYLELDLALKALGQEDPDHERVVMMRYIGGFSIDETARALDVSPSSVDRMLYAARAFLQSRISRT